jgi:hypothetical protein
VTKVKRLIFPAAALLSLLFFQVLHGAEPVDSYGKLFKTSVEKGYARVIVKLDVKNIRELTRQSRQYKAAAPGADFPFDGIQADLALEDAVLESAYSVLHGLNGIKYRLNHTFASVPYMALDASPEALAVLSSLPGVLEIYEDWASRPGDGQPAAAPGSPAVDYPMLNSSTGVIGADNAWSLGYTGKGWYVAVLDTGIRRSHQFFQGKTIVEACFSANNDCPDGSASMTGPGSAAHYESTYLKYDHGTHVTGIAAGSAGNLAGVAKKSNIIAVQVCSRFDASQCGGSPCVACYVSDQMMGLDYIYTRRGAYNIAAVNISLGGNPNSSYCDSDPRKPLIDNLAAVRIAVVAGAGNDGVCNGLSTPSCIPSAVAVGASDNNDNKASFSNWHDTMLELFAPGVSIYSATGDSDSSYSTRSGTSMATPHLTGAWALLRQAAPGASTGKILNALRGTGAPVGGPCSSQTIPRIQVDNAIYALVPIDQSISVTAPNGGENWIAGSKYAITWNATGIASNVKIEYTIDNGAYWATITSSAANGGSYSWTVPDRPSSNCRVRVSDASDGSPSDTSDTAFTISSAGTTPAITVLTPNGGENWEAGSKKTITWTSAGSLSNVKIELSTNNGTSWSTIIASTPCDGSYSWSVRQSQSSSCLVKISDALDGSPSDTSDEAFTIFSSAAPGIALDRKRLSFGAAGGIHTGNQKILIENNGGGTLEWSALSDSPWLGITPMSGTGSSTADVLVDPTGLAAGTYTGVITFSADEANNSPQTLAVTLNVYAAGSPPFGQFATPENGSTMRGSIPVTGWVLDDIDIETVEIYNGSNYIGTAVLVEGARPDVEARYPGYPKNYQAGWGYMLLTHFLPNRGNGVYTLYAIATDAEGHRVTLGSKTVNIDNANAVKPFGAIDSPGQGETVSGKNVIIWGWALTPPPNKIPIDGSTINVLIDGVNIGRPVYNIYREDIAGRFPGYLNNSGAVGYFYLDSTAYENGVHTLQWTVTDDAGNTDGIGSRYFIIQNTGNI